MESSNKNPDFHWGDELTPPPAQEKPKGDGESFTSVEELMKAENEAERKRLAEYLQKKDGQQK